jgi:hypothetical protein
VAAAVAVARAHGVRVTEPRVLSDLSNVIVWLAPAPVVAVWTAFLAERHPEVRARAVARLSRWVV